MTSQAPTIGPLLRSWRQRRRLSQLDLANQAGVTSRHLSFVETGRSKPSREMVLHLAEHLDVPLRERNNMLIAAGYAPTFRETDLDDPGFQPVKDALDRVLAGHMPYPAIVVDRHWALVAANAAAGVLIEGIAPELLEPPVNVLRVSLHPKGLAPRIVNIDEWTEHILGRLRRQVLVSGDDGLAALEEELHGYVEELGAGSWSAAAVEAPSQLATSMRLRSEKGELSLITTLATFGSPLDITLSELLLEAFLPADEATTEILSEYAADLP